MDSVRQPVRQSRLSHDSTSDSNGLSISPSSQVSDEAYHRYSLDSAGSSSVTDGVKRDEIHETSPNMTRDSSASEEQPHIIQLSSIEHCMPRAYIRVCLAYRIADDVLPADLTKKLNRFARKLVDSKPYLAGHVVPAPPSKAQPGLAEIHFTNKDFLNFPEVKLQNIENEISLTYAELDELFLPPSLIRPEIVSALPEGTNDDFAPVFRLQANLVKGGLIVSAYLHHCISDGTGLGLILTGSVLKDDFAFDRHLESKGYATSGLNRRLEEFANQQTIVRQNLSWSFPNQIRDRRFQRSPLAVQNGSSHRPRSKGRGCIFVFAKKKLAQLESQARQAMENNSFISPNDVLQAFLWHHMTAARAPSLQDYAISTSKLFTPVNIRSKIEPALSEAYFGAAVDFATTELPISTLSTSPVSPSTLADTALSIRSSISAVDESYIRQAIALARDPDPAIDVRDLMGSSMNRTYGADMYITSWQKLNLYHADMELDLGPPDWVRKPWSKDPGSCIVLPDDKRKDYTEVLVQMTEDDMEGLMANEQFMENVARWVE